ncbi:GNAT family N-acetyltransferase [Subtercola endophyticus]|uniref:GNAT family N-acetyltransferase n=1 Tax=Subtercola endophyticus TaxID=2895559 RepID=UPI001E2857E0|nr:GNAT family N-acetyltransferase [Subtercola endophyticus]UFS57974.1 GNAT family N-acetyltransferase [Subtercola endophyticus]
MTVLYRQAEPADSARLALIAAATFAFACPDDAPVADITSFITTQLSEERFAGYLADENRMLFLAENDGVPVGYTMVILGEPADPDVAAAITVRPTAELSKMYVFAGHHGSGVAAELMARSVEAARAAGASGVWLGVNDENARANRFYEKNGFAVVGAKTFQLGSRLESDFVRERLL